MDRSGVNEKKVSATLLLCLFAAQSGLIALSPVLVQVAGDLDVSTAAAGQLRTVAGLTAGFTALALPLAAGRVALRSLLVGAALLLAIGSLASAAAPSFALLALAQGLVGVAIAILVTSATAAAAEWVAPEARARVLSWALVGNPAAWIVGMPLLGVLGEKSWRYGMLALPLAAAVAAALGATRGPATAPAAVAGGGLRAALADRAVACWALGELAANSGWIGLLVYVGALFTESYGTSSTLTGAIMALAATAFVGGNLTFRRWAGGDPRPLLIRLALLMAILVALVGTARPGPAVSALLFAATSFLGGARTLLGNAFALGVAPDRRRAAMAARAAANQFGYFVGAAVGGIALAAAGYPGLGIVLGLLLVAAAATLFRRPRRTDARPAAHLGSAAAPARAR